MNPAHTAFYLDSDPDPALAQLHTPAADLGGAAVLFVPGVGWDDVASAPIRLQWANQLAAEGHPALRIDLPGAGDSGGKSFDPGRLAAWTAAVSDAAAALRSRYPQRRIVAIGLGLGGVLAWKATAAGAAIDDLVLWGVPSKGSSLVRELRAFARLKDDVPEPATAPADGFAVAGYVISRETDEALSAIDLTELAVSKPPARRLLLISRDGLPVDERLQRHAEAVGFQLDQCEGHGWAMMTSGPHESVLPTAVVGFVAEWVNQAPVEPLDSLPRESRESGLLPLAGALERPWATGRGDRSQFGILAEPRNTAPRKLGVLLLSGGVSHGPSRMWVETARRWAPQGVPVLRLQVDEDNNPAIARNPRMREARLYDLRFADQAADVVVELVRAGVAESWLVVGLCAGAAWAFNAALLRSELIGAAVLINPFVFEWEEDLAIAFDVGRTKQLRRAAGWRRLMAGNVDSARVRALAGHVIRTPVEWPQRRRRTLARVRREEGDLDHLRDAGTQLTFLIGQDEPIVDRFQREGLLDELERWPNLTLRRLPTSDHSFRPLELQRLVHRELDAAITAELDRLAGTETGRMYRQGILAKTR